MVSGRDLTHAVEDDVEIRLNPPVTPPITSSEKTDKDGCSRALIPPIQRNSWPEERPEGFVSSTEDGTSPSPPDGGYGWLIVLGTFIVHVLIGGLERTEGVFFLQFQAKFHQNAQLTAWPGALTGCILSLMSPIVTSISSRYSIRTCCMIGGALQFIGFSMNGFAPNFYFLFISHALLVGLGRGFLYAPSVIIVNMYFDKRRGLGMGVAASGVGVGSFCLLPLTQFLFDMYGYSGAFIVISAVTCHSFFVAMLFRPLSLHYRFTHSKRNRDKGMPVTTTGDEKLSDDTVKLNVNDGVTERYSNLVPVEHESSSVQMNRGRECVTSSFRICFPREESAVVNKKSKEKIFHFHLLKDPSFLLFSIATVCLQAALRAAITFVPALVKSKGYTDTQATLVLSVAGVADTISRILIGFLFDVPCIKLFRTVYFNLFLFALAVISFMLPSLVSLMAFCIAMSLYGSFSGAYISQRSVVVVDILGAENVASAFGILVFFQGIGAALGPPLSGAFRDAFGTFTEAFYLGGALMLLAGTSMACSNVVLIWRRRKNKKDKRDNEL